MSAPTGHPCPLMKKTHGEEDPKASAGARSGFYRSVHAPPQNQPSAQRYMGTCDAEAGVERSAYFIKNEPTRPGPWSFSGRAAASLGHQSHFHPFWKSGCGATAVVNGKACSMEATRSVLV